MTKITIRPSSLVNFVSCSQQWYRRHILGEPMVNNVKAVIGTGVHKAVEVMWQEAIKTNDKTKPNRTFMLDAGIEKFDDEVKKTDVDFLDLDADTARSRIIDGVNCFVEDILPFTPIPLKTEQRFTVKLDNPFADKLSGTVDYISSDTIADIKTSGRKISAQSHVLQQSAYKYLAEQTGHTVKTTCIQGIVLNETKTSGCISKLEPNVPQMKFIVNNLLKRLNALDKGIDPDLLFPGNPKHYLCSDIYCSYRKTCRFVNG